MSWRLFNNILRIARMSLACLGLAYMLAPIFVILLLSVSSERYLDLPITGVSAQWYQRLWDHPGYMRSFMNTLIVGIAVSGFTMVLGTMAALAVVRGKLRYGKEISSVIMAPLIMPQIILAIGIFPILAGFDLIGSRLGVIVSHTAVALPLVFMTVSASLRGYSQSMELAAMTLGANNWQTFVHVTFPMIRLGMVVGGIFAFAFSFDEIIIALFLTDASSVTLPVFMWNELRFQMDPTIAAASTVAIVLSLAMLSAVGLLQRRSRKTSVSISRRANPDECANG
ncbi:MAG: ABC transporter permease [Parvibaculaceae bacterium]